MSSPRVFVCGATGTQGGALVKYLVKHGIGVHAITRNIDSVISKTLQLSGVHLTEGDFNDEQTLGETMSSCTALFLNVCPTHNNPTEELEQAKRMISIAKRSGIEHIIYTSILSATNTQKMPYWNPDSVMGKMISIKESIENEVRRADFQGWKIVRPGNFMSNYLDPVVRMYPGLVETGEFRTALSRDTVIHMVDPEDIGKMAAAAIMNPTKFHGKNIEVASEVKRLEEVMYDLSTATGRDLKANFLSEKEIREQITENPFLNAQLLLCDMPQLIKPEKVECWGINLGTFARFLQREKLWVARTYLELGV
ncbi:uncharacterized protein N7496_000169 [Penicillium cataractarum]|uniref:NmrA-like domain-containing protein n=1 Tax=Penicillium cataractarum TaxID=2100454 RepID=A0A9W9VTJ7_9EURO|nr:uncharacterized protein N7496_000169 [Penicillium cataractarum]KAJ5389101.1 hypothetical protein N7496_000169 [Penicillium cataractarum]